MKQIVILHGKKSAHHNITKEGLIRTMLGDTGFSLRLRHEDFQKKGLKYHDLDNDIISIYLESCGQVILKNGNFYPISGSNIPVEDAYEYCAKAKWKNHQHWELYYEAQIEALKTLLVKLCEKYNIPKTYNPDMWEVSKRALMGTPGIWGHCSFREDAMDPHPQIELVNMLKSL
jgi:hypothetical protein